MASVSVIILSEGRQEKLTKCLNALVLPQVNLQVIVLSLGMELNDSLFNSYPFPVELLNLPKNTTRAEALNQAIMLALGEWIHLLDEDVYWSKHYFEHVKAMLEEEHFQIIGGPELPARDVSETAHAMYLALSSPFCQGVGFSRYRMLGNKPIGSNEEKLSSSNIWIRRFLIPDNIFPREYNQSAVSYLLQHLKLSQHQEWYHPKLFVLGNRSASFLPLRRRIFQQGYERSMLIRERMGAAGAAYTIPVLFILFHFFVLIYPPLLWPVYKLYLMLIFVASVGLSFKARKPWIFPLVMFFHWFLIWEYGWGFLIERISRKWKNFSPSA